MDIERQFYSITNNAFPGDGTVSSAQQGSVQSSLSASGTTSIPTTTGSLGTTTTSAIVVVGGGGSITIAAQTRTETGTFSTAYLSGVTANTVTTTTLSGASGPTILPIWFCPGCVAAAAGILIIPEAVPAVAGLIPPPAGFSALEIGPDGQATPTGSPASGSEPTGDPRSSITSPTPSATASSASVSSASSDGSESTVNAPEATGNCPYWSNNNNKRASLEDKRISRSFNTFRDSNDRRILVKRVETQVNVPAPLGAAIAAIGGPNAITSASSLQIVTNSFPNANQGKVSQEDRFITGIQGRVSQKINEVYNANGNNIAINMQQNDFFRIRWDYDPVRGIHVNAEFFPSPGPIKIAFFPNNNNRPADPTGAEQYQQVVRDQSDQLDYNTVANDPTLKTYTPMQRSGANLQAPPSNSTLLNMAQRLAARWSDYPC